MKALRIMGGVLNVVDVAVPARPAEAIVRVIRSGICSTDLEIVKGYAGFEGTIGHEFVGVVEVADDTPQLVGKRVVGEINAGCGKCSLCIAGDPRHCEDRTVLGIKGRDGAHAEYLNLPPANLLAVPDGVSDDEAVFAEPLAAAYGILEQVDIGPETRVAVIGDGKLGILCSWALGTRSNNVMLIGKHPSKLEIAEEGGAEGITVEHSSGLGREFDVVVEASGSETGFAAALNLVRPRGKIVLKSTFHGTPSWEASRVVVDEITIVGSRCGRMGPALDLLAAGLLPVAKLISETLPLAKGVSAMDRASQPGVLKVLLDM